MADKNSGTPDECRDILLTELAQAVHADEISEVVWQAIICAYLDHEGWRDVAEALFVKHGYTVEEIIRGNSPSEEKGGMCERCDDDGYLDDSTLSKPTYCDCLIGQAMRRRDTNRTFSKEEGDHAE